MSPPSRSRPLNNATFSAAFAKQKTQSYSDPTSRGPHSIRTLAWNPLGTLVATGAGDRSVRIWNPEKTHVRNSTELRGHAGAVERLAWNPVKEAELASCGADGSVRFWDVRSKAAVAEVKVGGDGFSLAWRPDGSELVVGRKDDVLVPVSLAAMKSVAEYRQPVQTNQTVFSNSGHELFVTTGEGHVKILDYPSMTPLHTLNAHTSSCYSIDISPSGTHLAVGGSDALLTLWDTHDWVCTHSLARMTGPVRAISFSFDGAFVVGASDEPGSRDLDVAHVETGEYVHVVETGGAVGCVAWHPLRYWLAYVAEVGGLKIVGAGGNL
ncbi:hypothetical protein LTR16_004657 [Cryomyces antarcticus]|uniref:Anaphase-promoting complex subunit 4 WD40 domain-containing protein n=1 Tax=Cryomyces antarcticus TaxID=329879 RepID=A0ABR0KRM8_9PEZI|nr:hypothetical protein LTR60_004458 [Cryomyces antarcticus]KAK5120044.1 hypothetical protein LTR16_004657 [Cryomyces antarcticus]KAK5154673.1 hypothetical protein LTR04_005933 [Oleoguttula sp. CCFEE 6159]